nr:hypothetical protein [uncultured Cellulosilyticum sp.]
MKKKFVSPTITAYQYAVVTQFGGSGGSGGNGGAHDAGHGGAPCAMTASNGSKGCDKPSVANSAQGIACYF